MTDAATNGNGKGPGQRISACPAAPAGDSAMSYMEALMSERLTDLKYNAAPQTHPLPPARRGDTQSRVVERGGDCRPGARRPSDEMVLAVSRAVEDLVAQLVAIREAERSAQTARAGPRSLRFAGWVLDPLECRLVAPGGGVVLLPALEFTLLRAFVDHPRAVLSLARLVQLTRRDASAFPSSRTIAVYVSRLRRRFRHCGGAPLIATVRRIGYVLDVDVERI
jgi:DNA-binding winged helix-turn-helix (wHTH) protein